MGTAFSFDVPAEIDPAVLTSATRRLHAIDATFSTYRRDSAINQLGRGDVTLGACPDEVAVVLGLCGDVSRATGGWFSALASGHLDPSGLVKGWAVHQASELITAAGYLHHSINGGGDVYGAGGPWTFGVTDPTDPSRLLTVIEGFDLAVATSGTAERGEHVLNPFTRQPATALSSVTVVGPSLTQADAFATAALAMGPSARSWLATLDDYDSLVVDGAGTSWASPEFHTPRDEPRLREL
jgi:thiamine biosynthesis lipoprotein